MSALRADLQGVLSRSTVLTAPENIQVSMNGDTVVLRGTVPRERDRRQAEGLIRLTPGVRDVRNEIVVRPSP